MMNNDRKLKLAERVIVGDFHISAIVTRFEHAPILYSSIPCQVYSTRITVQKGIVHQVITMLATSKNVPISRS